MNWNPKVGFEGTLYDLFECMAVFYPDKERNFKPLIWSFVEGRMAASKVGRVRVAGRARVNLAGGGEPEFDARRRLAPALEAS